MTRVLVMTLVTFVSFRTVMAIVSFLTAMIIMGIWSSGRGSRRRRRTMVPVIHTGMRISHDVPFVLPT